MKKTFNVLIAIIVGSCSACSASHRLANLIAKHPELTVKDTILLKDTIVMQSVEADTVFRIADMPRQVLIKQGMLEMEVRKEHDTLYLKGKCAPDTIFRTHEIPVEKIKVVKADPASPFSSRIPWIVAGLIAISISIPLTLLIKKKII